MHTLIGSIAFAGAHLGEGAIRYCAMPPPPPLTLPFSKKEQNLWCQVTEICHRLF